MSLATDLIYIVFAALFGGVIAHILRQPLICGYILAGIVIGPHTGGFTVQNIDEIEMLASVGVALLLFTLGLEFSLKELRKLARVAFVAAPLQILVCAIGGYGVATLLNLPRSDAVWIGIAVSLSSTMVVIKILTSRGALQSEQGRILLAFLIAQDVAIVPLMLFAPHLTGEHFAVTSILTALVKSILFLLLMYWVGTRLMPRFFVAITRYGSRELFFLSILSVALGAGILSHYAGLSFALGAFVAGMLLSETDFSQRALSDISTLRDLFALIFFVSVGMLFDPQFFISNLWVIALFALTIMISKAVFTAVVAMAMGYSKKLSWMIGLGLAQVGEFAFVIIKAGNSAGYISHDSLSLMIAVTVVTMIATPALFWIAGNAAPDKVESP